MLFKSERPELIVTAGLLRFKGGRFEGKFNGGRLRLGRFSPAMLVGTVVESPLAGVGMELVVGNVVLKVVLGISRLGRLRGGKPGILGRFKFSSGKFMWLGFPADAKLCRPGVIDKLPIFGKLEAGVAANDVTGT